jgi:beta-glucosidase
MVRGMVERGLKPMVTLHHFSDPLWLMAQGGWESADTPQMFVAFVSKVVEALKDYVNLWVTTNEPNGYVANGYIYGAFPPGKHDLGAAFKVMANLVRGHAAAYQAIHQVQKEARVGVAHSYRPFRVARKWLPLDWWAHSFANWNYNLAFARSLVRGKLEFLYQSEPIPQALHTQDFMGINYYSVDEIMFSLKPAQLFLDRRFPRGHELSETGFVANVPSGLFDALRWARSFRLPIMITENGVEGAGDELRQRYIVEHIYQACRAIKMGWPIEGFYYWTLVDNFEWERGWTQCFGLWGLNPETQERIWRPSVDLYAAICKDNGLTRHTVEQFAPELLEKLYRK